MLDAAKSDSRGRPDVERTRHAKEDRGGVVPDRPHRATIAFPDGSVSPTELQSTALRVIRTLQKLQVPFHVTVLGMMLDPGPLNLDQVRKTARALGCGDILAGIESEIRERFGTKG